ncbi:MAG TPA: hypothetical protein VNL16_04300 [Chloroflexota bacterium]|nr:hypothetical protein [Chloroflexota bacterium]
MYAQLLAAALAERPPGTEGGVGVTWPEVLRLRAELFADLADRAAGGWDPVAVATQISYDAALIEFARRAGITFEPSDFDLPYKGRSKVETALRDQGRTFEVLEEPEGGSAT